MSANDATQQANRSAMDPKRLVVVFYLVFGLVFALFLDHVLDTVWAKAGWSNKAETLDSVGWRITTVLGVVLSAATCIAAFMVEKPRTVSLEIATELMKVTWPSWDETRVSTIAVVLASIIAATLLYGIDFMSYKVMVDWIPAVWGKL